jgi:hypothetical protein
VLRINGGEGLAAQFGYSNAATNNAAILNHMFSLSSVTNVRIPAGLSDWEGTVTVPNNKDLYGAGTGFASNFRTKISYIGPDGNAALQIDGFYTRAEGFMLDDPARLNNVGIKFGSVKTRHYLTDITITGFSVGIRNSHDNTSFTHVLENVYIKDCRKGLFFKLCNNLVLKSCFIESCDTGLDLDTIFNLAITDGSVLEIFGDDRLSETNTSVLIEAANCANIVVRDSYVEIGTLAIAGTQVQIAKLTNVRGFTYRANYHNRSAANMLPHIEIMDGNCSGVTVKENYFLKGNSTGTDFIVAGAAGFEDEVYKFDVSANIIKFSMLDKKVKFDPVLREAGTEITGITYSVSECSCYTEGANCTINFALTLTSKGAATAGALTLDIPTTYLSGQGGNAEILGTFWAKSLTSGFTDFSMDIESGQSKINFARDYTTSLSSANLTNTTILRGQITFPLDRPAI